MNARGALTRAPWAIVRGGLGGHAIVAAPPPTLVCATVAVGSRGRPPAAGSGRPLLRFGVRRRRLVTHTNVSHRIFFT
jgi:hypothetical protein